MSVSIDLQQIDDKVYALDVRGHVCPYPELLTLRALQSLSTGDSLEVMIDNPPSVRDIPITTRKRGYPEPKVTRIDQGTWKLIVQVP